MNRSQSCHVETTCLPARKAKSPVSYHNIQLSAIALAFGGWRENLYFGVSDQARHKPGYMATEAGEMLEMFYLGRNCTIYAATPIPINLSVLNNLKRL